MLKLLKSFFKPKAPAETPAAPYKVETPVAQESAPAPAVVAEPAKEVTSETVSKPAKAPKAKAPAKPKAEKKPAEKKPAKPKAKKAAK